MSTHRWMNAIMVMGCALLLSGLGCSGSASGTGESCMSSVRGSAPTVHWATTGR